MKLVSIARRGSLAAVAIPFAGVVAVAAVVVPAAQAAPASAALYVSPGTPAAIAADTSCETAGYSSVQAAVSAAPAGGTVVVCKGTYDESVTIAGLLTLQGEPGAVIDAKGAPYAIGIAHSNDTVAGLTVEGAVENSKAHAPGDGIITAGFIGATPVVSNDDVIVGDTAENNQGAGIDLNSTSGSIAAADVAKKNGVGINVSNDLGAPASHNSISGNTTDGNTGGCGIALADHTGAGVFDNTISGNVSDDNGLGTPSRPNASSGSGLIFAGAAPKGGVYDNTVQGNQFSGNGHGGVALHMRAAGGNYSGNRIIGNVIGTNNVRTDYEDTKKTGIYLGAAGKVKIVISKNLIEADAIGIFTAGSVKVAGTASNAFKSVKKQTQHIAKYAPPSS
jgi:parallel beta-helix repeat protein